MAGKPELSANPNVQNVVVYVSNDNFAQAYAVGQQNVPQNTHPTIQNGSFPNPPHSMATMVGPSKSFQEKSILKSPDYSNGHIINGTVHQQQGYFTEVISQNSFPQPVINNINYQNGAVINQVKNYNSGNGDVLSGERQAGPGRPELRECERESFVDSSFITVMGAECPTQSVRCDSVRSETAESSCSSSSSSLSSSLSSADEGIVVVQNPPPEMVVYDSSVSVRPGGVVLAVGPSSVPPQQGSASLAGTVHSHQNSFVTVPYGWKRLLNNGNIIYISPSNTALNNPEQAKEYLLSTGTCKCGLECPFKYDSVFNFDPKVAGKPWTLTPDTNTGDLTKLCNHKRKIIAMMNSLEKSSNPNLKLPKDYNVKKKKRKIGVPYGSGVSVSQILAQREKLALNRRNFNRDNVGNQQVWSQPHTNNTPIASRIQGYSDNTQLRYPNHEQVENRVMPDSPVNHVEHQMMNQQIPGNISHQNQQIQNQHQQIQQMSNNTNQNIQVHHHHIIGPNGQVVSLQKPNQMQINNQNIINNTVVTNPNSNTVSQNQIFTQSAHQSNQHRIYVNGQPNEPSGPGRPNVQMVPINVESQQRHNDVQQRIQQQFYSNQPPYPQMVQFDPSKNIRSFVPPNNQIVNGFRPHGFVNQGNQMTPVMVNQQQKVQWQHRGPPQNLNHPNSITMPMQTSQTIPNVYERVPPLHQHTPASVLWQEEMKKKKVKLSKIGKNRPYNMMECQTSQVPCPNIDVRQIPNENTRAVIINQLPQVNQSAPSPSFMEDPSGYLAQQTALLNNTINRQTGANSCGSGYICNSPSTSMHSIHNPSIISISNTQTNEVPLPSNIMMKQTHNITNRTNQSVNMMKSQLPHNVLIPQQFNQMVAQGMPDSSALNEQHMQCQGCIADSVNSNHYNNREQIQQGPKLGHSRPNSEPGTPSSSGNLDDPVISSTYSDKISHASPDNRPIQGGTVSTSNVSPADGIPSGPPTPNPSTPNPHTPNSLTPNSHTPNPLTPNPNSSNPQTPGSHTPNPHTANPHSSNSHIPNSHIPSSLTSNPLIQNHHMLNAYISNSQIPHSHMSMPHNFNIQTSAPHMVHANQSNSYVSNVHGQSIPQRISEAAHIANNVPFVVYSSNNNLHQIHQLNHIKDGNNALNYQTIPMSKADYCLHANMTNPMTSTRLPYIQGIVTTMASGRTVGSNTITSVLAGRANTATVSVNSPQNIPNASPPTSSPGQHNVMPTQAVTVKVSKSPLEMVQSVVSSIQVPHSQHHFPNSVAHSNAQISPTHIVKHSAAFPPGHILVSSGGQLIMASTGNCQPNVMPPPPPKLVANQGGMPPISVSPMVTNVTAAVTQMIPAVAQQVLGQQTVLVNALPAPFVLQPGMTMTMDGVTVGQNMQIPQLVGNVIQQQIQIDDSDSRRVPTLLSPENKKKGKKRKVPSQTVASMLHIAAAQQNPGVVMSQQGFPQQIQMAHSPQAIATGSVMQALTMVPGKNGGPPQLVMNGQAQMTNANLGTQQLITNSQPTQQINLLQPVNLINGTTGMVQNFPTIQQFIVPNLGGMVMNPDGTATILQDTSNLGMQLQLQNVNGQNVLTPVQNSGMFNGSQSILAAGPAGMVIRAPATSQGKLIQQQQHSPGAQFLSPNGGQFVVNSAQFSGQLSPLVASVSPSQQVTFGAPSQQIRPSNLQQDYIQCGQMGQTLMVPCTPTGNIAASTSNQQNTTYVQQNTTIVQQQTTMVSNNQQLQNYHQNQQQQNQQNLARTTTLNVDQNFIISSNDNKQQVQAVLVRENPPNSTGYRQSVSTQTAANQNCNSVTTNTFCQTSTASASSPPDTTTHSPMALGGHSPHTADTTTHSGSTDDGLSPAPSNCSTSFSDINAQGRHQSCTMAMVHCISSSEPDSADLSMQSTDHECSRNQQSLSLSKKNEYLDISSGQLHYNKKSTPTHIAYAESSTMVSGLQFVTDQTKPQEPIVSSRNFDKLMHKRKNSDSLLVMQTHHMHFDDEEEADSNEKRESSIENFIVGDLVWGESKGCSAWPGKIVELIDEKATIKWYGNDKSFSKLDLTALQTLSEGLDAHHRARKKIRKSRKLNAQLENAIQEAMAELDKHTVDEDTIPKSRNTLQNTDLEGKLVGRLRSSQK